MLSIQEALRQMQEAVHIGSGVDPMRVGVWMIVIEEAMREKDAEIERLREDAERYRFLRDEDNWGCDNDETTESRWGDLGECHGGDFDAFVDKARAALNKEDKT